MKKVMCFGTFDHLHPGHLHYLTVSKEAGDYLTVIVARDANVKELKGRSPVENEKLRLKKIKQLDFVNQASLGNLRNKLAVLKKYNPDIISLGYDQPVDMTALKKVFFGKIIRQKSFKPEIYKSSKIKHE